MAPNEEKLQQLQMMEQSMSTLLAQKQQFQSRLAEIDSAVKEMKGKENVFRIIGSIMVETEVAPLQKSFHEQKEMLALRIKTIEKQEDQFRDRAKKLQDDVMKDMKKD
ncbi:MAG: prefoldin subunit [Nanoarchaeota archaeon]